MFIVIAKKISGCALSLCFKTSLSLKISFGTQRNLKGCCSESIYKEHVSNAWYIDKTLCSRTEDYLDVFKKNLCTCIVDYVLSY